MLLKSGDGAFPKLNPAMLLPVPKGCWDGVGDVVVEGDDAIVVVALSGEREPGSAWREGDCENAVRSFWRERAGERR